MYTQMSILIYATPMHRGRGVKDSIDTKPMLVIFVYSNS